MEDDGTYEEGAAWAEGKLKCRRCQGQIFDKETKHMTVVARAHSEKGGHDRIIRPLETVIVYDCHWCGCRLQDDTPKKPTD